MSFNENSRKTNVVLQRNTKATCNCGWEVKFGYGAAVALAIFEAKRFFMLLLEIFAEWQVIRFAGGLRPVVLTWMDVTLGFPTALITVRTIRAKNVSRCYVRIRKALKCLLIVITICAIMNTATLVSIGYHISVREEALVKVFNTSMHFYVNTTSSKYAIDEIQFIFQCCGPTSYIDWFNFDWQRVDYASREDMENQEPISDENLRDHGVPFSCCDLTAMTPCVHSEILDDDVSTINTNGCAEVMSPVLIRIVIIAYIMTSTMVIIQVILAYLISKIIQKTLSGKHLKNDPPATLTKSETKKRNFSASPFAIGKRTSKTTKKPKRVRTKDTKRVSSMRCLCNENESVLSARDSLYSSASGSSSPRRKSSRKTRNAGQTAKINPSTHEEHTISKKRWSNEAPR